MIPLQIQHIGIQTRLCNLLHTADLLLPFKILHHLSQITFIGHLRISRRFLCIM